MVRAVVLDVNETLLDLSTVVPVFVEAGLKPADFALWFARTQRDGFALSAAGDWRSFGDIGRAVWRSMAPEVDPEPLFSALANCPLHPDVVPGIAALRDAGVMIATLTIGAAEPIAGSLTRAGVAVDATLSCDDIRRWKPAPEPYQYAAQSLGVTCADCVMIAVHDWDLHGARAAGLRTAWVNRSGAEWSPIFDRADIEASDLPEIVGDLAQLAD
jgi:2-haloacid dehalogenase